MPRTKVRFYNWNNPRRTVIAAVIHQSYCRSSGDDYAAIRDLPIGGTVVPPVGDGWWEQFPTELAAQVAALLQAQRRGASPLSINWEPDCRGCVR